MLVAGTIILQHQQFDNVDKNEPNFDANYYHAGYLTDQVDFSNFDHFVQVYFAQHRVPNYTTDWFDIVANIPTIVVLLEWGHA
jgi:hypothetical protein